MAEPVTVTRKDWLDELGLLESVQEFLLDGDGFVVSRRHRFPRSFRGRGPSDRALSDIWRGIFDRLVQSGQMRRSESGHYWWNTP